MGEHGNADGHGWRVRGPKSRPIAVAAAAVVVVALGVYGAARPGPTELEIDVGLLTRLQTLAGGLHQEIVLCLDGSVRGRRATAKAFSMPIPRLSTPTRSSFDSCPPGTLASWHNHPRWAGTSPRPVKEGKAGDDRARRLCVLSETDIATASRLRHPFVVVSVDARTWCWWTLEEVDRFAEQAISPGPPAPGRLAHGSAGAVWARPAADPER